MMKSRLSLLSPVLVLAALLIVAFLPTLPVVAGGEDCLPYNPSALYVVPDGDSWLLTDGVSRMLILDNETDANTALAVARQHTAHCFIGRDNDRPNRRDYIVEYWTGASGLATPAITEDCLPFNPANLTYQASGDAFIVTDGVSSMLLVDNDVDAQSVLNVVDTYNFNQHCFIGRGNSRPNRSDYIMEYWKSPAGLVIDPGVLIDPGVILVPLGGEEDCIEYDPATLSIVPEADYWLLQSSGSRMSLLDTQADAEQALAMAQNHTAHCFIGRDNDRPNRSDYIFEYWRGDSGFNLPQADADCIPYDPATLMVAPNGSDWLLMSGPMSLEQFASEADANAALAVVAGYNAQCFLGRDNTRPERNNFILTYWVSRSETPVDITPTPTPVLAPPPALAAEDCYSYNPAALYIVPVSDYFILTDGIASMVQLDNEADANRMLLVAQAHMQQCFIGRGNARPNRAEFIVTYWQ